MDNNNKTLKQLLTEPCRVQKKDGYYSYEAFRQKLMANFIELDKKSNANVLNTTVDKTIDSIYERILYHQEKNDKNSVAIANKLVAVLSIISFLKKKIESKKIFYLDDSLFALLEKTKLPPTFKLNRLICPAFFILLPSENPFKIISALIYESNDSIICLPIGSDESVELFSVDKNIDISIKSTPRHTELFFNFLLWQQSMHDKGEEVIELDAPTRKMGFGKNSKQIIIPRVIGEGYKPKIIRNYEPQGTHASPRTHWRSGHWRQHMIGSRKNPEYKTIWIEPTLINA